MSGSVGTGQPLRFQCHRKRRERMDERLEHVVTLTGRLKGGFNGYSSRMELQAREYTCSCGHVGWSRHPDLRRYKQPEAHGG